MRVHGATETQRTEQILTVPNTPQQELYALLRTEEPFLIGEVLGIWVETNTFMTQGETPQIFPEILRAIFCRDSEVLPNQLETKSKVNLETSIFMLHNHLVLCNYYMMYYHFTVLKAVKICSLQNSI